LFSNRPSPQHPLQFLHAPGDVFLQLGEAGEDLAGRAMGDFFVDDFFVAVQGEVVVLARDVLLRNEEGLGGAGAIPFCSPGFSPMPSREREG
jgi:hypothetical protein